MPKKAFVSGCFDMLHSGHVAFFEEAARYGDLYVAIGSDRNVYELKHRPTINNEAERLYMIQSLTFVKEVFVARGSGILDFVEELKQIKPDFFIVNEDGSTPAKKSLCEQLGIEYVVLKREPHSGLAVRSTTALRSSSQIPEYLVLAGAHLDKPEISSLNPGPALVLSILPFSGNSSTARQVAVDLWDARLPANNPEKLARMLYGYGNLPGSSTNFGSSAALGITCPGLTRADYHGQAWPSRITTIQQEEILGFIENSLYLVPFEPNVEIALVSEPAPHTHAMTAKAAEACWQAVQARDLPAFGHSLSASFNARTGSVNETLQNLIKSCGTTICGWDICSIAGQPWLMLVSTEALERYVRINIRRADD